METLHENERRKWFGMLEDRFGIPARTFDGYVLIRPGSKYLCIVPDDHHAPATPDPGSVGMVFIRTNQTYPKLTTAGAMAFGHTATRNCVSVDRERAAAFLTRQSFPVNGADTHDCTGTGYVIVKHESFVLGLGILRRHAEGDVLESLYPKGWATH